MEVDLKKNILNLFLEKLFAFPLWVKQVIYLKLHQNLKTYLSDDFIAIDEQQSFHVYVPVLSFLGKTELAERKAGLDENIYNFLTNIKDGLNILEMSLNNFWTLEEIAKYFILCLESDFIKTPDSTLIVAMAGFMAGKYKTGEFFKRSGKINVDQLEKAILKQKELIAAGEQVKIAAVMISLGMITEKDTSSLLVIKEEAKKRFILDSSIVPAGQTSTADSEEIELLRKQNLQMKAQLAKLLSIVKKSNANKI